MSEQDPISIVRALPRGARFYRCALQVNSYEYLIRHHKTSGFQDEKSYNAAIIQVCKEHDIEVLAITDHYRVRSAASLWKEARDAGLHVFPGLEAVTKEGAHFLCLFDPNTDIDKLERVIGDCGIHDEDENSPIGKYDVIEFLTEARKWEGICVAAHVASQGGLLRVLTRQPRINAWHSPNLSACSLPGPVNDAPDGLRPILENKNPEYRRDRPVAIINAQDVNGPEDLATPGSSCWMKMSEVSIEGLRQAFLDPESRIRLASDPMPEEHVEFVAMAWQGGFLNGQGIHFNENLNVLIGGRGTGKSTVVESLRHVLGLEPLGEEARDTHKGFVHHVLRNGTKISLIVRSHRPSKREYWIERTIPNPPVVRDESGQVLNLDPQDVVPQVEVYGQHEIAELARSPEKRTHLLDRFVERDPALAQRKSELRRELERSRVRILQIRMELEQTEHRLASLPALEETLRRYHEAGVEKRLKEQSLLVREERVLKTVEERLIPFREVSEQLRRELPIDRIFLSSKALEDLPGKEILREADAVMEQLSRDLEGLANQMGQALERAEASIVQIRRRWEQRKNEVQAAYESILRELQRTKVDGEEFIRLRREVEELHPLRERQILLRRDLKELEESRRNLLAEWEDVKGEEFRQLDRAAKRVSRQLAKKVRVQVDFAGDRESLFALMREHLSGRLSETIDALRKRETLSLGELADTLRDDRETIAKKFGIPPSQADRLAQSPPEMIMQIEELDLSPTTRIDLNVAAEEQPVVWRTLEDLSTGQKATAMLLLLLLETDAPLVIDQPEDDLDNRFITEDIVPTMREEKRRRQFVFSTHNANIPVLCDAELILGLKASGEAEQGYAEIPVEHMGSIDAPSVRNLVEEILEGGKEAFETRRLKYGF